MLLAANGGVVTPDPVVDTLTVNDGMTFPEPAVVVTGSRVRIDPNDLPASVTVLNRADFDVEKPTKLADVLKRAAGVHIDQVGGRGGTGSLYLRGADPNYTLVLVDGVRVNDPTNARGGSFDFSLLDVVDVERVEIARGPYSAVYGGDALAGVINIVTRPARLAETRLNVDAWAGAYDTREFALSAAGPLALADGLGGWNLGASDANEGALVRGNDFESQRISGGVDFEFGDTQLYATARYSESERAGFPDDSGGYGFAAIRDPETREASEAVAGFGVNTRVGDATFGLSLGLFDRDDHIDSPGIAPGVRDPFGVPPSVVDTNLSRYSATLTGTQKFSDLLTVAYGVDWLREQGESVGELDFGGGFVLPTNFELTRTTWAPFAEARIATTFGLSSQLGVRLDKTEDESVTSPRVRVAYEFADTGLTIAGAWGKAFKLPSLYALGHPLVGNPTLAPERGESREIEFSQSLLDGKARWSATWFEGEFRNAIDFDSGPPPMLVNRNRVDTKGVELAGRFAANEQWQFDGSVTNSTSEVASSGNQLRNRPEWRGGVGAHFAPLSTLRFSASATYVGGALDSSVATGGVRIDSYTRVDASAVWQVSETFQAFVAVDNLTDEKYEEFVGNEVRGGLPRAGVRLTL